MNIALLGYGRMGQTIEKIAEDRGHTIVLKVDKNQEFTLKNIDVAIDFSIPEAALNNISTCINSNVPVVSGTTGWLDQYEKMTRLFFPPLCKASRYPENECPVLPEKIKTIVLLSYLLLLF